MRPAQRMAHGLTIRLASAGHKATDCNGDQGEDERRQPRSQHAAQR
jgi:hypothetical protein